MLKNKITLQRLYIVLTVLGTLVPLSQFVPWLFVYGLDISLFIDQLWVNPISRFFALDVVISALVLTVFIVYESQRLAIRNKWIALLATFSIGVSSGLPLFLYLRQQTLDEQHQAS
tara:strand:- start:45 stop:392 length:348 start_codon:yes stop_codon:yes gene_type:complete